MALLYLVVAKTLIGDIGFRPIKKGQPDVVLAYVAIVLSLGFLAWAAFVPSREGAAASSRIYLSGYALVGLGWGLGQLKRSKTRRGKSSL